MHHRFPDRKDIPFIGFPNHLTTINLVETAVLTSDSCNDAFFVHGTALSTNGRRYVGFISVMRHSFALTTTACDFNYKEFEVNLKRIQYKNLVVASGASAECNWPGVKHQIFHLTSPKLGESWYIDLTAHNMVWIVSYGVPQITKRPSYCRRRRGSSAITRMT